MAEPLIVDPPRLEAAGSALRELTFPEAPPPIAVAGTDAMSTAISATAPIIEGPVVEGLPVVKAAVLRSASSIIAAARAYTDADRRLGGYVGGGEQPAAAGVGDRLSRLAAEPSNPVAAADVGVTPAGQAAPDLEQIAGAAGYAAQGVQQGMQVVMQEVQQVAGSMPRGGGAPAHLASQTRSVDEAPAAESRGAPETFTDGTAPGGQPGMAVPVQPPVAGPGPSQPEATSPGSEP